MNKLDIVTHKIRQTVTVNSADNRMELVFPSEKLNGLGVQRTSCVHEIETFFGIEFEAQQIEAWETVQNIIDDVMNLWVTPIATYLPSNATVQQIEEQMKANEKEFNKRVIAAVNETNKRQALVGEVSPEAIMPKKSDYVIANGSFKDGKLLINNVEVQPGHNNIPSINSLSRQDVEYFANYSRKQSRHGLNVTDEYQKLATKSAIYPGQGTPLGLDYVALKLNGEAGEFAEHVGKAMRDDNLMQIVDEPFQNGDVLMRFKPLTDDRRALIIKEIGDVLWYLSAACNELGINLSEAALTNLEKLADRTERNALRGSGDVR